MLADWAGNILSQQLFDLVRLPVATLRIDNKTLA